MIRRSWRIGQRIGEYRLVRTLGRGGAGEVFAAVHEVIGSRVVIKLLRPDRAGSAQRGRLLGEAQALAQLDHPHIVKLLHAATLPDGNPYLVLTPLSGMTLRRRLRKVGGRLPLRAALGVLLQVTEALAYAHGQGVLHRDVKPENLIVQLDRLAPGGLRVTLIDFGLAKFLGQRAPRRWDATDTCLETADGVVLGTPPYRAPEQGAVPVPTPALDAFAVGVLAWELLTGTAIAVAPAPANAATLDALHPELPTPLRTLVWALLAPLPEQRPARLEGVAMQFRELLRGLGPGSTPNRSVGIAVPRPIGSLVRKKTAQLFRLLHPRIAPLLLFLTLVAGLTWTLPHLLIYLPKKNGRPVMQSRAQQAAMLVLAQPQFTKISDSQIERALSPGARIGERVDIVPLPLSRPDMASQLDPKQWEAAAAAQAEMFRTRIAPRLGTPDAPRIAYFGMAPIPLIVHLGSLLGLTPIEIYHQNHRGHSDWRWDRTAAAPSLQIQESGVPTKLQRGARTVVVRIATSFFILPEDTRRVLPNLDAAASPDSLIEIDISLAMPDPDALRSPEDIAKVADRFGLVLDAVANYLPDVQLVHLFAAVPPALALSLGRELRPNVHPAVQTYQYGKQLTPHYHAALLIQVRPDAAQRPPDTAPSLPETPAHPPEESMPASPASLPKIEQRLERFVDWLKPDAESEATIRRQADEIRQRIRAQASADGLVVRETPSAGSFAKNTGLRRHVTGGSAVEGQDVDLHFVLSPTTRDDVVLDRLLDRFYGYAQRAYPQNPPKKSRTKSSVTLEFVGTKLSYDLVPLLIAPEYGENYQWLLRSDGVKRLTSVTRHVEFTRSRTRRSNSPELPGRVKFNECVRLLKWWREFRMKNDRHSIPGIPSIVIDMLAAYAFDKRQVRATYSETLYDWFDFLHAAVLRRQRITFTDYALPPKRPHAPATPWMVIDPVDPNNNFTRNWIDQHVDELAEFLLQGRTNLRLAIDLDRKNNPQESLHYLVRLFGPPFRQHCDPPAPGAAPPSNSLDASRRGDYHPDDDDDDD